VDGWLELQNLNFSRLLIVTLTAVLVALLVWELAWNTPIVVENSRRYTLPSACGEVTPGMTFSEMSQVLHRHGSVPYENADFLTRKYSYGNARGTCEVNMDQEEDRVTEARFRSVTSFDLRQGQY
jgi:hypothetical protein